MTTDALSRLEFLDEPELIFANGQCLASPKDGLYLFGPLAEDLQKGAIRIGVIGTSGSIGHLLSWIDQVRDFVPAKDSESPQHRPFPGFSAVFGIDLVSNQISTLVVTDQQIDDALLIRDRHLAIFRTVEVFAGPMQRFLNEEEIVVDVWIVVIPERIYQYGRPKSVIPSTMSVANSTPMNKKLAKALLSEPSLFDEDNRATEPYMYEVNFHNQLKARLLEGNCRAVIQIVRETAIAPDAFLKANGQQLRRVQDPATIAWNLCTTTYFKSGRRPWRLARIRDRVCYVGLVFKQVLNEDEGSACCGAQMFLDSGDGLVFKGIIGRWRSASSREYHLSRDGARSLLATVLEAYHAREGIYPSELFIHGKAAFNDDEWQGFTDALPRETKLVGVRIRSGNALKLFRPGSHPVLRGTAMLASPRTGYLWTRGYIPYLRTYPGRETPNPLRVDVTRGEADLMTVLQDVLALTKLNFNACIFGDGLPVTLRFANTVGEILTAGPDRPNQPPLPFKHYI